MATNHYFNHYGQNTAEQKLVESLLIESIKSYGIDVHYMPRTQTNTDSIYGEDRLAKFEDARMVEMYIKSIDGFEGDGTFVSNFGLEVRDQITFTVSRRRFQDLNFENDKRDKEPLEGDLIWFPMTNKLFEIQFVDHESVFYQLGKLPVYDLSCELFEYSDEDIDTGIEDIDKVEVENAYAVEYAFSSNSDVFTTDETVTGTNSGATATVLQITTSDSGNIIRLTNIVGTFSATEQITGATSGTTANLGATATEFANDPKANNATIQTVADGIIDFSEGNPFSEGSF